MKKSYLLICILLLAGCSKHSNNEETSFVTETSTFSSVESLSVDETISSEKESSSGSSSTIIDSSSIEEEKEESNYFGYWNMSAGDKDYSRRIDFKFDYTDLIYEDNQEYNSNFAKLGLLLSASSSGYYVFLDGKSQVRPSLMKQMEMDDVEFVNLFENDYEQDYNDSTGFDIAHKKETVMSGNYEIIMVSIRGTYNNDEWISNVDLGIDCDKYYELTGNHPEWINKDNHKGFDIAANRVIYAIDEYIANYVDDYANKIIFITGHSRGGSIANLVGKSFEEKKDYKTFCYCYAPAGTTTASNIDDYLTIFNIANDDDVVCALPPRCIGFNYYGTTMRISAANYSDYWNTIYDFEYVSGDGQSVTKLFKNVLTSREGMFDIDYEHECKRYFFSQTKAISSYYEDLKKYKDNNLDSLYEITYPYKNEDGIYEYEIYICPYYALQLIINSLESDSSIIDSIKLDDVREIIANRHYISLVLKLVSSASTGGIVDSHMFASYYAIIENYNPSKD